MAFVYSTHMFLLLLRGEAAQAKLLWKRCPSDLKTVDPNLVRLGPLIDVTLDGNYVAVLNQLQEWSFPLQPALLSFYRQKRIYELSLSYETIDIPSILSECGIDDVSELQEGKYL